MKRQKPDCLLNAYVYKEWEFVRASRKYLNDLILGIFKDHHYAEKVATASSELIENAYKYSPDQTDFNIILQKTSKEITLQVRNFVKGDPQEVFALVEEQIQKVYEDKDPQESFRKKVMASLTDTSGKSMLGYAKIRLETGAILSAELEEDELLCITAVFPMT